MNIAQHTSLFVFGTLRDEDVLRIVLGRDLPAHCRRRATLADHDRLMLHDETYPVLVPVPGSHVPGAVLTLTGQDMARVRFFEADEYAFEAAQVLDANGESVEVVLCVEGATRPGPRYPWSLRQWQRQHKHGFLEHARTYMALFGTMSATQADLVWRGLVGRD